MIKDKKAKLSPKYPLWSHHFVTPNITVTTLFFP